MFLSERDLGVRTRYSPASRGTRPVLVNCRRWWRRPARTPPRRGRLGSEPAPMVLAVLEAHCGVKLSGHDVYLNVAGGLRSRSPRPTSPPQQPWSPRWSTRRCPPTRSISARFRCRRVPAGGANLRAAEEAAKLGSAAPCCRIGARGCRRRRRPRAQYRRWLTSLVADIAARGSPKPIERETREHSGGRKMQHLRRFRRQEASRTDLPWLAAIPTRAQGGDCTRFPTLQDMPYHRHPRRHRHADSRFWATSRTD